MNESEVNAVNGEHPRRSAAAKDQDCREHELALGIRTSMDICTIGHHSVSRQAGLLDQQVDRADHPC